MFYEYIYDDDRNKNMKAENGVLYESRILQT